MTAGGGCEAGVTARTKLYETIYLGDRVTAGGGCEAGVTATTKL